MNVPKDRERRCEKIKFSHHHRHLRYAKRQKIIIIIRDKPILLFYIVKVGRRPMIE